MGVSKSNKINLFNSKDKPDGYWEWYHDNGQLDYKGYYVNGMKEGYWEFYHDNGNLDYKGNYINGNPDGYFEWYYRNGELREIEYWIN